MDKEAPVSRGQEIGSLAAFVIACVLTLGASSVLHPDYRPDVRRATADDVFSLPVPTGCVACSGSWLYNLSMDKYRLENICTDYAYYGPPRYPYRSCLIGAQYESFPFHITSSGVRELDMPPCVVSYNSSGDSGCLSTGSFFRPPVTFENWQLSSPSGSEGCYERLRIFCGYASGTCASSGWGMNCWGSGTGQVGLHDADPAIPSNVLHAARSERFLEI